SCLRSNRSLHVLASLSGLAASYSRPLGTVWLAGCCVLPAFGSSGGAAWTGGLARRLEVSAIAAVDTVCHSLAACSCCQMTAQKNPANRTTQKICKSRGRLIP